MFTAHRDWIGKMKIPDRVDRTDHFADSKTGPKRQPKSAATDSGIIQRFSFGSLSHNMSENIRF